MEWQVIPWTQEMLEESVDFLIDVFSRENIGTKITITLPSVVVRQDEER